MIVHSIFSAFPLQAREESTRGYFFFIFYNIFSFIFIVYVTWELHIYHLPSILAYTPHLSLSIYNIYIYIYRIKYITQPLQLSAIRRAYADLTLLAC